VVKCRGVDERSVATDRPCGICNRQGRQVREVGHASRVWPREFGHAREVHASLATHVGRLRSTSCGRQGSAPQDVEVVAVAPARSACPRFTPRILWRPRIGATGCGGRRSGSSEECVSKVYAHGSASRSGLLKVPTQPVRPRVRRHPARHSRRRKGQAAGQVEPNERASPLTDSPATDTTDRATHAVPRPSPPSFVGEASRAEN
jgi:hypothetical protein